MQDGVSDAIWRIATNATDAPCADFYEAIKLGTADGYARAAEEAPHTD